MTGQSVALAQWVEAVNAHEVFGTWAADVVTAEVATVRDSVGRHA